MKLKGTSPKEVNAYMNYVNGQLSKVRVSNLKPQDRLILKKKSSKKTHSKKKSSKKPDSKKSKINNRLTKAFKNILKK